MISHAAIIKLKLKTLARTSCIESYFKSKYDIKTEYFKNTFYSDSLVSNGIFFSFFQLTATMIRVGIIETTLLEVAMEIITPKVYTIHLPTIYKAITVNNISNGD